MKLAEQNFAQVRDNFKSNFFEQVDVLTAYNSTLILFKSRWTFHATTFTTTYLVDTESDTYVQLENNRPRTVKGALRILGLS